MTRARRLALGAIAATVGVASIAAAAFLAGIDLDGGFLRPRLEAALTAAFGMPTRIEGPLRLRTGRTATLSADTMVLADPTSPGASLARGIRPAVRIDLVALMLRSIDLEEVSAERLELDLRRGGDGRANWAPMFTTAPDGAATVSFAGIGRLRIDRVVGSYSRGSDAPTSFAIEAFAGSWRPDMSRAGSGTLQLGGQRIGFDLRTESTAGTPPGGGTPLRGTFDWSGVRIRLDGRIADGAGFAGQLSAAAADATAALASLGVEARIPGPFAARGRIALTATELTAQDLELSIGATVVQGTARARWGGTTPTFAADFTSERIDAAPFAGGRLPADFSAAFVAWLSALEQMATGIDAHVELAAHEIEGLPLRVRELRLEARGGNSTFSAKAAAGVAGTPVEAALAYDAKAPHRTLRATIDSGPVPVASLRQEDSRHEIVGSLAGVRGRLRGEGENPRAIVASLAGELDARGVDWTLERQASTPLAGRFDTLRIGVQGTRSSSVDVTGRIGGSACRLRATGAGLAPLLAGESWPLQLSATCPGERVAANGSLALAGRLARADLTFDFASDRDGPAARAAGVPDELPHPIAAKGRLIVDDQRVVARVDALRFGRTAGTGEIELQRATAPARVRLALTTLDLDEIAAAGEGGGEPASAFERPVLRRFAALPDADFDIAAAQVHVGGTRLRDLGLDGSVRARVLRAPFRFQWQGTSLGGQFGLDASGATPRLQLDGTARNVDLGELASRLGFGGVRVRAEKLSVAAGAKGERAVDLVATANLSVSADGGQVDLAQRAIPGQAGRGTFTATIDAQPGRPATLTARGEIDGQGIDIAASGPGLEALTRPEASDPISLRATFADMHVNAEGHLAPGGGGAHVQLSGAELDRLGTLLGISLPATGPYSASADVAFSASSIEVSSLQASFGSSQLAGSLRSDFGPGRRPLLEATLRSRMLHLEDLLGRQSTSEARPADGPMAELPIFRRVVTTIEQRLDALRAADARLTLGVDALLASGETIGSGRVRSTLAGAQLAVLLQDVRAQQGRADAELRVDASEARPRFELLADVRDFEFGPLTRALDASSSLDGRLDLVARLESAGPARELESTLAGTVDIAIYPRGMRSGALGLLGTSIVPAILRQVDPRAESAIECSVSGFSIADGVARSDGFFILTTQARFAGDLEVRLATRSISGRFVPRPRTPQLFTLAPTLVVGGTLENPTVSGAPENLLLVPLRFASPISLFATDWLNGRSAADSAAACREAFERIDQAQATARRP